MERLAAAYHAWEDAERFCRVVDLDELKQNDFNLNIPRYVDTTEPEEPIDVAEELLALKALMTERDEAERKVLGYLEELGYGS